MKRRAFRPNEESNNKNKKMSTKTTTVEIPLPKPSVRKNVRSDLRQQLERYWVDKETSNIGLQYLSFKEGVVRPGNYFERTDLFIMQYSRIANVFLDPRMQSGGCSVSIQPYPDVTITKEERVVIMAEADKLWTEEKEYVEHEIAFLKWIQENKHNFDGITPAEVRDQLQAAGF